MSLLPHSSKGAILVAGLAGVIAVGIADELTGPDITSTLLYLLPVAFVAWFAGLWPAIIVCAASAEAWLVADLLTRSPYPDPASRYWNVGLELGVFVLFAILLAGLRERLWRARALARVDPLTGLSNRRAFREAAAHEIERARRFPVPLTVVYIDIDNFKKVNDRHGHGVGDALLVAVASALQRSIRRVDVAARLGGDEFAVLLPDTGCSVAEAFLQRLRQNLRGSTEPPAAAVTFSIGAVTFLRPPATAEDLLRSADRAMYRVKRAGKDASRHEVLTSSAEPEEHRRVAGERGLALALGALESGPAGARARLRH